ncbi:MAG: NHL repeat-containing protein [Phycisphaerae bacterium]|nr:NHL repeat-containing protein [Phycisphaerae bacterium]
MPHQMIGGRVHLGAVVLSLLAAGMMATGCASPGKRPGLLSPLAHFPDARSVPRVTVYGSLGEIVPRYDATPALERFLYGPSDFGKTALQNPQGMVLLGDRLLVCDQGQYDVIAVSLTNGQSLLWTKGRLHPRCPVDVTSGSDGRVYVADTTARAVLVYEATGTFIEKLAPEGDAATAFRPCGVLVHEGLLYVADLGGRCVGRWSTVDRRWLEGIRAAGGSDKLTAPSGLCMTPGGELLVVDAVDCVVQRYSSDGRWLGSIGGPGRLAGQFVRPKQVCCTRGGLILVSDSGRQSVMMFGQDGAFVTEIHERGQGWRGWTLPMGLVVLTAKDLPALEDGDRLGGGVRPDEYVVISDALGAPPLTVLGITGPSSRGASIE